VIELAAVLFIKKDNFRATSVIQAACVNAYAQHGCAPVDGVRNAYGSSRRRLFECRAKPPREAERAVKNFREAARDWDCPM